MFRETNNTEIIYNIKSLFKKHFEILNTQKQTYDLPEPKSMFREIPWQLDSLLTLKDTLNEVKSRLNNFSLHMWQQHTNQMNKAGDIVRTVRNSVQPELVTQAWCKFYEIACNFDLVPLHEIKKEGINFTSIHLCEAPGAFVTALNHWLKLNAPDVQWNWLATTLNPYCEGNSYDSMIADDRFIKFTLNHWCFGADNTGDIMNLKNLDALIERSKSFNEKEILLVTADGSIDCTDMPGEQESIVAPLHLCETVACMHLLQKGGNFLLKIFTLFERQSVCLMYLLSCSFHQVTLTKPASSKAGNSEVYVVCKNFRGKDYVAPYLSILRKHYGDASPSKSMFRLQHIPNKFLEKIEQCSKFYKNHQCQAIEDNIKTFRSERYNYLLKQIKQIRRMVASNYLTKYNLKHINPSDEIVGREIIENNSTSYIHYKLRVDSYNDRCKKQELGPLQRLLKIANEANQIEVSVEKSYTWHFLIMPETAVIRMGKLFHKIYSSRFCDTRVLHILHKIESIAQHMRSAVRFPDISTQSMQEIDLNHETAYNFQFTYNCDSCQILSGIYYQLKRMKIGQTFVLIGYSLLTQFNVGLLYLLGNFFDKMTVEICDNEGYRIKLETYQHNEQVLKYLTELHYISHNAYRENMAIWSIIPMMMLHENAQFYVIMQLNHLMIKMYAKHVLSKWKADITTA